MLNHFKNHLNLSICPLCQNSLKLSRNKIICTQSKHCFFVKYNLPLLFIEPQNNNNSVTKKIKKFYEKNPFPNYDSLETINDLINKSEAVGFPAQLSRQIPFNSKVLEIGCGTGQLSNFLGIPHRYVFGTDISISSLKLAQQFKKRHQLDRVGFYQMNLFKPIFKPKSFDYVICNGVLHHTSDPLAGFRSIAPLVKPDGYIILGLYHKYGRWLTNLRRQLFKLTNNKLQFLDPLLRKKKHHQKQAWLLDQYYNPHESTHTFKEILDWFKQENFEFISSLPQLEAFSSYAPQKLFDSRRRQISFLDYIYANWQLIKTCSREGGVFIIIGKRITS